MKKNMVSILETFKVLPTKEIRVKAAAYGFEKALLPDSRLNKRVKTSELLSAASKDSRLLKNSLGKSEQALIDGRTWRTWRKGKPDAPHALKSYCEQLTANDWPSRILETTSLESPILLLLYTLDSLFFEPKSKKGTEVAKRKIDRARIALNELGKKWTINQRFSRLFIPENWLHPIDIEQIASSKSFKKRVKDALDIRTEISMQSDEMREKNIFINAGKLSEGENLPFGGCVTFSYKNFIPKRVELKLNEDVCSRYETESPLTFLQYLLRMSIYIENDSEFPIHTYAIDLLTAAIATYIFAYWYEDDISERLRVGPIGEAIDSALKIFFSAGSADIASHLIHTAAPWGRKEQFPIEDIERNLGSVRRAYLDALHEYGITQFSIKKKLHQFYIDSRFGMNA